MTQEAMALRLAQLLVLTLSTSAAIYAKAALGPLQETLRVALSLTDNEIALLQGAALAWPMLVIGAPLGLVVDRWVRVRMVTICALLLLVGSAVTALASGFATLFAARAIVGLAAFSMGPPIFSLIADLYPPASRGRAYMVVLIGQFSAVSLVFWLGGALVATPEWGADAWRLATLWLTGPLLVLVVLMTLALAEPPRTGVGQESPSVGDSFAAFWRLRPQVAALLVGRILPTMALAAMFVWAAPALARTFELSPDRVGAIIGMTVPVGGISGTLLGGVLADRCQRIGGPRRTISVAGGLALFAAPGAFCMSLPTPLYASVGLGVAIAILTAVCMLGQAASAIVVPNELRGLFSGTLSGFGAVVSGAGAPILVSAISTGLGGPHMIGFALGIVCFTACILAAVVLVWMRGYFATVDVQSLP